MTLYEFKSLSEQKKYDITFKQGVFLDYHLAGNIRYALYAIDKFFVEVEYKVDENKIINLVGFIEGNNLDRYSNLSE